MKFVAAAAVGDFVVGAGVQALGQRANYEQLKLDVGNAIAKLPADLAAQFAAQAESLDAEGLKVLLESITNF